ncbi:hypothetical protein HQ560_02755, partial [bacterium]|nr:hypothetical protein [bacterium]
ALCRPEALAYIRRRGPELFAMSIRTAPHALDWRLDVVNPVYWTYIARGHALAGDHARAATIYKRAIDAAPSFELSCDWLRDAQQAMNGPDPRAQPVGTHAEPTE